MIACVIVLSRTMRPLMKMFCGPRRGPRLREPGGVAGDPHAGRLLVDAHQVVGFAVQLVQALGEPRDRRALEQAPPGADQREPDRPARRARAASRCARRARTPPGPTSGTSGARAGCRTPPRRRCACPPACRPRSSRRRCRRARGSPSRSAPPRARVRSVKCDTDAMLGSASPRKPSVAMAARSSARRSLLVACRSIASRASSGSMPDPVVFDAHQALAAVLDGDGDAPRVRRRWRSRPAP